MNMRSVDYLCCCSCLSSLSVSQGKPRGGKLASGILACSRCGLEFPVVSGRPLILTHEMLREWRSPVDEALGITEPHRTFFDSMDTLRKRGISSSLETLQGYRIPSGFSSMKKPDASTVGKMKYRASGEWFKYGNRAERLLSFPYQSSDGSFSDFMGAISDSEPDMLLDLASGGGFGVSQQAFLNSSACCVLAVERDLKCLGNIQYRFQHTGRDRVCDAVGGDVRHIPVKSSSVDTAMMLGGLPEIHGVGRVLDEAARVLKPGGPFIVLLGENPFQHDRFSAMEYRSIAAAGDLYAGGEGFVKLASSRGWKVRSKLYSAEGNRRRLAVLTL